MFEKAFNHGGMIQDQIRNERYFRAINETVQEGDVVADIGTGTGLLAFFAVKAGARKVYAIEEEDIIEDAQKLAELNNMDDKIVFIQGRSDKIELPEKVDVVTSEIIGYFGLDENLPRFNADARKRFLKTNGKLLPAWLDIYIVPVESTTLWQENVGFWSKDLLGVDYSPIQNIATSERHLVECENKLTRVAPSFKLIHMDYYTLDDMPALPTAHFTIQQNCQLHGFIGYFISGLTNDVIVSTAPDEPLTSWKQSFFPVSKIVDLKAGDVLQLDIGSIPAKIVTWHWDTKILRAGEIIEAFSQTNFNLPEKDLYLGRQNYVPMLTEDGMIRKRIFELAAAKASVNVISETIFREFPQKYSNLIDSRQRVVDSLRKYIRIK
jgi:SAM-dependent methyltransferase